MIVYKTQAEIERDITDDLTTLGIYDMFSAPILSTTFAPFVGKLEEVNNMVKRIDLQTRLSTASGDDLDYRALETAGIERISLLPSEDLTYSNFHFYLPDGKTAAEITSTGGGFTIPSGVVIDNGAFYFETLDAAVFAPGANAVYVRVRSTAPDTPTIGVGELTNHNLVYSAIANLDTSIPNLSILCKNDVEIIPTTYEETDDEFRYRTIETIRGRSGINESTLRSKLREIGVVEYVQHNDYYGLGRAGIEVVTNQQTVPDPILVSSNEIVKEIYPGNRVIKPIYLMTKLVIDIDVIDKSTLDDTKVAIKDEIIAHMDDYRLGSMLNLDQINAIVQANTNVRDGDCVCVYINGYKATLTNQISQSDEKFVLDVDDEENNVVFAVKA